MNLNDSLRFGSKLLFTDNNFSQGSTSYASHFSVAIAFLQPYGISACLFPIAEDALQYLHALLWQQS